MTDLDELLARDDQAILMRVTEEQAQQFYDDAEEAIENDQEMMELHFTAPPDAAKEELEARFDFLNNDD